MNKTIYLLIITVVFSCKIDLKDKSHTKPDKSEAVFLELWHIFEENYAFFELKNIDWRKEKSIYIEKVKNVENDSVLFEMFCQVLRKFDDAHINLESTKLEMNCNSGSVPYFYNEFPDNESFSRFLIARNSTLNRLGVSEVKNSESQLFQFGISENENWAYLRIKRFYGVELSTVESELNNIMSLMKSSKNLILDIRVNPGGNDETALLIASFFFKKQEIAFIKQQRNGLGYEDFSERDTSYVEPRGRSINEFNKLFLLTNGASGSSADVFALTMSQLEGLSIVGTNTEGIFSNMYRDTLMNDWTITLSNERYFSKEMKCYEGIGIPVDIEIKNSKFDIDEGKDKLIEYIIELEK